MNIKEKTFPKGNIAKYFIYKYIKEKLLSTNDIIKIVDMGSGSGKQWDWLYYSDLKAKVEFHGFDIDKNAIKIAKDKKPDWNFYNEPAYKMEQIVNDVDIITTLSALEHVYKRKDFLNSAKMLLKKDGIFYLNYDNGHFLSNELREKIKTILGPVFAKFGWENWYQSFVWQDEIEKYIGDLDFIVKDEFNFHQSTNKQFHRIVVDDISEEYMELWLNYEVDINRLIKKDINSLKESNSNKYLLSKLFILSH